MSPFKENGTASPVVWRDAGKRSTSAFGEVRRAMRGMEVLLEENLGVLQGNKTRQDGPRQHPPRVNPHSVCLAEARPQNRGTPSVPTPARDGRRGDMSLIIAFQQTLGLPQEVTSQVSPSW